MEGRVHCWIGKISSGGAHIGFISLFKFIACLYDQLCILMLSFLLCAGTGRRHCFAVDMVRWPWGTFVQAILDRYGAVGSPNSRDQACLSEWVWEYGTRHSWPWGVKSWVHVQILAFFFLLRHCNAPFLSDHSHLGVYLYPLRKSSELSDMARRTHALQNMLIC